jgi:hypothetical protein
VAEVLEDVPEHGRPRRLNGATGAKAVQDYMAEPQGREPKVEPHKNPVAPGEKV